MADNELCRRCGNTVNINGAMIAFSEGTNYTFCLDCAMDLRQDVDKFIHELDASYHPDEDGE